MKNNNLSPKQIQARSEATVRVVLAAGAIGIGAILSIGGIVFSFFRPDQAKDIWLIIGPIFSAIVSAIVTKSITKPED